MNVVITMAGQSQRFKDVGVIIPKYEIVHKGRSVFQWAISSLENFFHFKWFFITLKSNNAPKFIHKQIAKIANYDIIELDYLTDGQATTALKAMDLIMDDEPILIYNIDTYFNPQQLYPDEIRGEGFIPVFSPVGDHWSFVKIDEKHKVIDIAEKIRISTFATVGLYYFAKKSLYTYLYEKTFNKTNYNSEKYIAYMYNTALMLGTEIYVKVIPDDSVLALGTPIELSHSEKLIVEGSSPLR